MLKIKPLIRIILLGCPLLPLLASYAGALHPAADSLAVFRVEIAAVCLIYAIILLLVKAWGTGLVIAVVALFAALPILISFPGTDDLKSPFALYQKNLSFRMADHHPIIKDIKTQAPDFLTLQEVSRRNHIVLQSVIQEMPYQAICPFAAVGDVALASRWPIIDGSTICQERLGIVAAQIETPDGNVWLVSIHLHWPWPHGQRGQAEKILQVLETLDGPIVIGGDFNMVPWSYIIREFKQTTDTQTVGPVTRTLPLGMINLPIDHVLAPVPGKIEPRPQLGSDHFGVLAQFRLRPAP